MAKQPKTNTKTFSLENLNLLFKLIKDLFATGHEQHEDHLTAIDSQIADIQEQQTQTEAKFLEYAPLDSPEFEGRPTAPTANTKTSDTQLATTQFVQQEIDRRAKELEITVTETDMTIDKIEALTSVLAEGGNPMYRLRDADGNIIAPATLTTHIVDPETKKSLPLLIKEAAHIVLVSEPNWDIIMSSKSAYEAFCEKYDGWYLATYDDDSYVPSFSNSLIDSEGNLTLDGTIDAEGNLTINATITENGILTL